MRHISVDEKFLKRINKASRHAFTLVELMITVVVIAILMGLLLPAVMNSFKTARVTQVVTEIKGLESAIAQFKSIYGVEPPSNITLCQVAADWSSNASSVAKINRIWPNFNFSIPHDFDNDASNTSPLTLTGAECLVFFLGGGHTSPAPDGTVAMIGFSKNPADPFSFSGGNESREGPFFEFKSSRLRLSPNTANKNTYVYVDPLGGQTTPYIYANSNDGRGYVISDLITNPADTTNRMSDVYRASTSGVAHKPKSFQIISPGSDGLYGAGGYFSESTSVSNHGLSSKADYDNITNFYGGLLND